MHESRVSKTVISLKYLMSIFVCFGLLSAIVLPPIHIGDVRIYLVTFISPVVFLLVAFSWIETPILHLSALIPMALGLMVILSSLFSWMVGYSSPVIGDIVESIKYLQFVPYYMSIPFLSKKTLRIIHKSIFLSAIVIIFVGYAQALAGPSLSKILLYSYLGPDSVHLPSALSGFRITITGSDPNIGAVICCFFCIYFASIFLARKQLSYSVTSLLFLFLVLLTQSRTALGALLVSLSLYFILIYRLNIVLKLFLLIIFIISIISFISFINLQYITLGFQYALEGSNNSLNIRLENISLALMRFSKSPIMGMGPAKSEFSTIIDSEYALIIQRYGILGISLFGSYIVGLFRVAKRNVSFYLGVTLLIFTLLSCIVMTTNNIFSGYQLMSIIVILNIACVLHEKQNNKSKALPSFERYPLASSFHSN